MSTILAFTLLIHAPVFAQAAAPSGATMGRPAKTFHILSADAFDPMRLLPPPPAEGSERHKAELAEVRRAYGMAPQALGEMLDHQREWTGGGKQQDVAGLQVLASP